MDLKATGYRRAGSNNKPPKREPANDGRRAWPLRALFFIIKWSFVLCIWAGLCGLGLAAWYARELPSITKSAQFERKPSITILANDGSIVARYGDIKGDSFAIKDLPPYLVQAVLATEDRRFYSHFGVDPIGLMRAMWINVTHKGVVQGGSTITQQLAKNLFLTQERTLKRKIQEALLALWLEQELSKDEILAAYLNRVYMGAGAYGVDAAAQIYFKKSAHDLNLREAAILAGLLKAPSKYSPRSNPGLADGRADQVIANMKAAGYLDETQEKRATSLPLPRRKPAANDSGQYFGDWVVEQIDDLIGAQEKDITIETTYDPDVQRAATENLARVLNAEGATKHVTQGAVTVMRRDGAVIALVGGRDYDASQFNRAVHALRQPGSSFKPIVYLAAIEQGWMPDMIVEDAKITEGKYRPTNFDGQYYGPVPLSEALAFSLNTVAVRLMQVVGVGPTLDVARRLGITADLEPNLSTALGSSGVPQIEMVGAFATMANGGLGVTPYGITKITTNDRKVLFERDMSIALPRMFTFESISTLNNMLSGVVQYGTGMGAALPYFTAGKTGTSQDYRDAWFTGFTNDYVASVWLGNDDNSSMKRVTGGSLPANIWRSVVQAAHNDPTPSPDHVPIVDSSAFSNLLNRVMSQQPHDLQEGETVMGSDQMWWGQTAYPDVPPAQQPMPTTDHNDPRRYND